MIEPAPPQDAERVRTGVVWLIGAAVVAVCAVVAAIAWWLVVPSAGARAAAPSSLERGMFDQATGGRDARTDGERRLQQTEWIDRSARTVHIPIERAIDAVVADPSLIRAPASAPAGVSDAGTSLGETGR